MQNLTSFSQSAAGNITCKGNITLNSGKHLTMTSGYFTIGSNSSTSGSGYALTSSQTKALGIYCDDNGTLYGEGAVRSAIFRNLITLSHSNETSIFGSQSQLKIKAPLDCTLTTGNRAGSWNYLEIAGTATKTITLSGSNKVTAGAFGMVEWDGVGALTLSSGHFLSGFAALTNVVNSGGTFTQTGKFCAFTAVNNSTADYSKFRYGLYLPMEAVIEGIRIAESANADGSGIPLSSTYTAAMRVNADTGSAALTTGSSTRAGVFRYLIGTAISDSGNTSSYGLQGQLKTVVSCDVLGNQGGLYGYFEASGTITLTGEKNVVKAGVAAHIDTPSGVTIASGTVISAFGINPCDLGGTHTGKASVVHVTNPSAGAWDAFLYLSDNTGCTQGSAAGSTGDKFLKVYINGVLYTIAMVTA